MCMKGNMKIIKVKNYNEMSQQAYDYLHDYIEQDGHPVVGLATGSTPEGLYQLMIEHHRKRSFSCRELITFNLDEYIGLQQSDKNSYHYYMKHKLFDHVDIRPEQAHLPNGLAKNLEEECREYDRKISRAGGLGLQILGIGHNGHIGFNEPGTPFGTTTHIATLTASTRQANVRFFNDIDEVPQQAICMGIRKIMESHEILLMVSGQEKAGALRRLLEGPVNEQFPASILLTHPHVTLIADEAALGEEN